MSKTHSTCSSLVASGRCNPARSALRRWLAGAVLVVCGLTAAHGDELQDVSKLVAAGRYIEAGNRADAYLAKQPKDAQMRFLKGVILSQTGQGGEAEATFTALTQDYPELPEPYNNLAVLYAAQGRYDDARGALETAIRVAPNDATAYENLGDIHAALAARAYRDARRHDAQNAGALRKLDAVRALLTPAATTPNAAPGGTPAPSASTAAPALPPAAQVAQSQRNIGLPHPAGPPATTLGTLAQSPEIVVPDASLDVPQGSNVVAIESTPADAVATTSTLAGTTTRVAAGDADATRAVADVSTAVQRWAASRYLTVTGDIAVRVDGEAATARFQAEDRRARPPVAARRVATLRRNGAAWTVTDARTE